MTTKRTRIVAAAPEAVWDLVADPHHLPRWWPGVRRMEGVEGGRWTEVLMTRKGRAVRADFHLLDSQAPGVAGQDALGHRRWEQELAGSPFERVLARAVTEVRIEPGQAGTRVTIEERQKLRGYSRLVGLMLRRASRTRLEQALDGVEAATRTSTSAGR